jgi:hypothetical protein
MPMTVRSFPIEFATPLRRYAKRAGIKARFTGKGQRVQITATAAVLEKIAMAAVLVRNSARVKFVLENRSALDRELNRLARQGQH